MRSGFERNRPLRARDNKALKAPLASMRKSRPPTGIGSGRIAAVAASVASGMPNHAERAAGKPFSMVDAWNLPITILRANGAPDRSPTRHCRRTIDARSEGRPGNGMPRYAGRRSGLAVQFQSQFAQGFVGRRARGAQHQILPPFG